MLLLEKAARCMNNSNHQEEVFKTAFELGMIPINNASKYHGAVAVYTRFNHFPLVIGIIHSSRSFLQKQHQQFFSGEPYSSLIIHS